MKKLISTFFIMVFTIFITSPHTLAADQSFTQKYATKACVVVIGDADVKTPDFFKYIDQQLNASSSTIKMDLGTEIQSKYQNYWFDKGFLEEQKLTKQDLHDFVKYSNYDKALFLLISSPVMEKTKISDGFFGFVEQTRASIEVKGFLVDSNSIIKAFSISKEDDSVTSELRAKRGAFEKCIKELSLQLKETKFS